MKRRSFLQYTAPMVTLPSLLQGITIRAFSAESPLAMLPGLADDTDHVLVIIQLNGGNDGLNTVIPLDVYNLYNNARSNIAIPESKVLRLDGYAKAGLHPAMKGMQELYNDGKLGIVQAVGYPQPNFSHFRATDIWMSGSDADQQVNTGWAGRYLDAQYPGFPASYPNTTMADPLAIQIGSVTSLTCQGPVTNMGMSISSATSFYNLVNNITDPAPNTPAGKELTYIRTVAQQSQLYAQQIKKAAGKVTQQSSYPSGNSLADQLKIVSMLIKGGLKTRIYLTSLGGFDNHAAQVNTTDATTGTHANLLTTLSTAIKAFQNDLQYLGIEKRVIGMTFSEFGRRIKSNGSNGTDHGAAAPLFVFGSLVKGGVTGSSPVLPANAQVTDNIAFQYDFRSVYATLLENWFCMDNSTIQALLFKNFQQLPLINGQDCGKTPPQRDDALLITNYPNPFEGQTTIEFTTAGGHTMVQIIDMSGKVVATLIDKIYATAQTAKVTFTGGGLAAGSYYARFQNGNTTRVRLMLKMR